MDTPSGVEPIPMALLERLLKATRTPPTISNMTRPIAPSDAHAKPEERLPPDDSIAISKANGLASVSTGEAGKR